jgi:hypothetical protein
VAAAGILQVGNWTEDLDVMALGDEGGVVALGGIARGSAAREEHGGNRDVARGEGLEGQGGVVERAQAGAGDEQDGEPEGGDEVDDVVRGVEGDEETTGPLDDDGAVADALPGGEGGVPIRLAAEAASGDAWSEGRAEAVGADDVERQLTPGGLAKGERVGRSGEGGTPALIGFEALGREPGIGEQGEQGP